MFERVFDLAREKQMNVSLEVSEKNLTATLLYQKLGFAARRKRKRYYNDGSDAVEMIKESPWIGYGIQDVEWNDMYIGAAGPHNIWLMLLLHGGIALCFGFISITYFVVKHTLKTPSTITTLSIISLCILLLMSLFEAYNIAQIFLLLQLIYYSPYLIHENDSEISLQKQAS
jgi:hypothetical protein